MKKILLLIVGVVSFLTANAYDDLYLRGDYNEWSANDASKMETTDGVTYTIKEVTMTSGQGFKVASSSWATHNYGAPGISVKVGGSITMSSQEAQNTQATAGEDFNNVTITFNLTTRVLSVSQPSEPQTYTVYFYNTSTDNYSTVYAYIWGNGSENATFPGVEMTKLTDKVVKDEYNNEYPVWQYTFTRAAAPTNIIISKDKDNKLTSGDPVFVNGGFYTNNNSVGSTTVTLSDKSTEKTYTCKIMGSFNGWSAESFTYANGEYTYTHTFTKGAQHEFGIALCDKNGTQLTNDSWYIKEDAEYTGSASGVTYSLSLASAYGKNMKIASTVDGDVTFKLEVDTDGKPVSLTISGGVSETPTPTPGAPKALYMHFKYDLEKGTDGAKTQPYCHIYNSKTGKSKYTWASEDDEKMSKIEDYGINVTDTYSIWKFDLDEGDINDYDAVVFYFKYGSEYMRYSSAKYMAGGSSDEYGDVTENDKSTWADYIYATYSKNIDGDKEYAQQTYMTYQQFRERDMKDIANGGRSNIYLIGWDGIQYFKEAGNNPTGDAIGFPGAIEGNLLTLENDHGCFYLPIKSTGNDSRFKISWINPNDYAPASNANSTRLWTTYDLGLCGVDKDFAVKDTSGNITWSPNYKSSADGGGTNGKLWFEKDKSVPYMNYNQADWVMTSTAFPTSDSQPNYWLIVDTHTTANSDWNCKTATITSFNPQPTLTVHVNGVAPYETALTPAQAAAMQEETFYGDNTWNPSVKATHVNTASGYAKVTATTLTDVNNARFDRLYTVTLNNVVAAQTSENLDNIAFDYLPLSNDLTTMSVRALFKDKDTNLTFHSRTSQGDFDEANFELEEPNAPALSGRYIHELTENDEDVYGIYVEGLDVKLDNPQKKDDGFFMSPTYHCYSDFEFTIGDKRYDAEFIHAGSAIKTHAGSLVNTCTSWTPTCGTDWSTYLLNNCATHTAPVYIHNVARVPVKTDVKELPPVTVSCQVYAVYPFMYKPIEVNLGSNAPARAAISADDLAKLKITLSRVPAKDVYTFDVDGSDAVSGVEGVAADFDAAAPVEYYTISGVRVQGEPAPGIYVRRQGDKVSKVVIK